MQSEAFVGAAASLKVAVNLYIVTHHQRLIIQILHLKTDLGVGEPWQEMNAQNIHIIQLIPVTIPLFIK